jgi:hypothetical protein
MSGSFIGGAVFSPCRTYRYRLERPAPNEETAPVLGFIMVNPSTADEHQDDQTIKMVRVFGSRHGFGQIIVGNLFAYRSKDVGVLQSVPDPIGPDNDAHLEKIMREADRCCAAWGAETKLPLTLRGRWREVASLADRTGCMLHCLDHLNGGHPRHPQILQYKDPDLLWIRPA